MVSSTVARSFLKWTVFLSVCHQCVPAIPHQVAYFNNLREKCKDAECTRRVGLCQVDQLKQTYNPELMKFKSDCIASHSDQDPDLCAHLKFGDYNKDGTMNLSALQKHFKEAFGTEQDLLGDLIGRSNTVCDSNIQAQQYLDCVLEGCLS